MDQMPIELRSPLRMFSFAAACCILVGLYMRLALPAYLASHLAAAPDLSNLNKAIRLEPSNAEYPEMLGRILALSGENLNDAIANYRTAVHLNPYVAWYWLDLAGAYQMAGRTSEQERSVERAVEADPTTPHSVVFALFSQTIRRRSTLLSSSAGAQPETRIRFSNGRCREDRICTCRSCVCLFPNRKWAPRKTSGTI
jgi:tetratricopeptide (TPR) repeat protein